MASNVTGGPVQGVGSYTEHLARQQQLDQERYRIALQNWADKIQKDPEVMIATLRSIGSDLNNLLDYPGEKLPMSFRQAQKFHRILDRLAELAHIEVE